MGQIREDNLLAQNPLAKIDDVKMYISFFDDYIEADLNIKKNGAIVMHPRTGSPIENPYLKIRMLASNQLKKLYKIKDASTLWKND